MSTPSIASLLTVVAGVFAFARPAGAQVVPYCDGTGTTPGMTPCPCGPSTGGGCPSSVSAMGAVLTSSGPPCLNGGIYLFTSNMPATSTAIYLMGDATIPGGTPFGDGVRCVDGALVRLRAVPSVGGASQFPDPGLMPFNPPGVLPCSGVVRYFQTYYRNAALFCTPATFNISNGLIVSW